MSSDQDVQHLIFFFFLKRLATNITVMNLNVYRHNCHEYDSEINE